jgi:prepilin-type N-terminal cleavage/methylation domain-containing protein
MQHKLIFEDSAGIHRNSHNRRAMTLVELLVVVGLVSIVFSIVVLLAVRLRQWDHHVRDHSLHANQMATLADTIRADLRHATSVTLPEKKTVAIASSDRREIRYELQAGGCRRVVKTPGEASPKIETYAIGPAESWKLDTASPGRRPAYTITLGRGDPDKLTTQSAPFFVYAALGSDLP